MKTFEQELLLFHDFKIIEKGHPVYHKNHNWTLFENGILLIIGNGNMEYAFDGDDNYYGLWLQHRNLVKGIILSDGFTSIQTDIFSYHKNLEWIYLPETFAMDSVQSDDYEDYFEGTSLKVIYGHHSSADSSNFAKHCKVEFRGISNITDLLLQKVALNR